MKSKLVRCGVLILLVVLCSGCGKSASPASPEAPPSGPTAAPTPTSPPPTPTPVSPIRQWAAQALASSEYDTSNWSAQQATGEPDVSDCTDSANAWASASNSTVEWIDLYYDTPVYATEVNVYHSYNADQVTEVALIDAEGNYVPVFSQEPHYEYEPCPYIITVELDGPTDFLVQGVRVTIDQTVLQAYAEIDAVELVGIPGEGEVKRPEIEIEAEPTPFPPPEGFLWRVGGEGGVSLGEFGTLGGVDTDANNLVYVADSMYGIWVFDADGNQVNRIDHGAMSNPADVKIGPDGNVYVAARGSHQIFIFTPAGELITRWGEAGTEDGQFGDYSPIGLAVGLDGSVYVLDTPIDERGHFIPRIYKFTNDGTFLGTFSSLPEGFDATALDVGPDGNLYVVDWIEEEIAKFAPGGNFLGRVGGRALQGLMPHSLTFDDLGNMYLVTWDPPGVVKLDPMGGLVAQFGVAVEDGEQPWPEGGFYSPAGAAALPDGSRVFVSDSSASYSYITAFEFGE